MKTVHTVADLRALVGAWRANGERIAFVPTMGNLHAGHLHLVAEAKTLAERVVASIFVNPAQFGAGEDFSAYPRTPEEDAERLLQGGTDLLFRPEVTEVYPGDLATMTYVEVPHLSDDLCGHYRPGHFRGVATVVCKLFNMVQPDVALFGEKDFQQLAVIRRMVADLNMPIEIVGVPTVRENSGLAMSSRNGYLTETERTQAALIFKTLQLAAGELKAGERDFAELESRYTQQLREARFSPDYFAIRRPADLMPPRPDDREFVILVAARLGRARLIDNLSVRIEPNP